MKTFAKLFAASLLVAAAMAGCKPTPKYALTDGQWAMTLWYDADGLEQMVTANRPSLTFTTDGTVSGSAGCNTFSGRYEATGGDALTIDMGIMTRKMCLDDYTMTLENRMTAEMPAVARYAIEDNNLSLYDAEGKELFRFGNSVTAETAQ